MPTEFVHLHVHSDYSLLDGACSIYQKNKDKPDLVKLAAEYGMSSVAITNHGIPEQTTANKGIIQLSIISHLK